MVAPNLQKLIVPNKENREQVQPAYGTDMRAIERWGNVGIVRKLIAGSDITLNPSDGVDQGQGIEISASGGGTAVHSVEIGFSPVTSFAGTYLNSTDLVGVSGSADTTFSTRGFLASGGLFVVSALYSAPVHTGTIVATINLEVSDATCANSLFIQKSLVMVSGATNATITGWSSGFISGSQLSVGTPQATRLILSNSSTNPYWITMSANYTYGGL